MRNLFNIYGVLAMYLILNIVFGTTGVWLYWGWLLIPVKDILKQEDLFQKSRLYTKRVAKLHSIWRGLLRVPAMFKAMFMPKNWWRLVLILALTLLLAVPVYCWPFAVVEATDLSETAWIRAQFFCKPASFMLHLCFNVTLAKCVGQKTFFMGLVLTPLLFGNLFLQFCLSILAFLG